MDHTFQQHISNSKGLKENSKEKVNLSEKNKQLAQFNHQSQKSNQS
jgi:hypothetical protein